MSLADSLVYSCRLVDFSIGSLVESLADAPLDSLVDSGCWAAAG